MSEAYLEKCLDSILQQTYQNLEVILINDDSTDGSAAICQRYKNQDARVKVYISQMEELLPVAIVPWKL